MLSLRKDNVFKSIMDDNMAKNRHGIVIVDANEAVAVCVADGTKYCKYGCFVCNHGSIVVIL